MAKRIIRGPIDPDPSIRDVFEEVDRVAQKLDTVLYDLGEITRKLEELASSVADVQRTVDEKE